MIMESWRRGLSFTHKYQKGPINYEHLRPPLKVLNKEYRGKSFPSIQKRPNYYKLDEQIIEKTGNPAIPFNRKIFYLTEMDPLESDMVNQIHKVVTFDDPKPPKWWKPEDTLRYIYEFDWDTNLICDVRNFLF